MVERLVLSIDIAPVGIVGGRSMFVGSVVHYLPGVEHKTEIIARPFYRSLNTISSMATAVVLGDGAEHKLCGRTRDIIPTCNMAVIG